MVHIRALGDNWIHIYEYEPGRALVVDPGESKGVLGTLEEKTLELTHND